MKPDYLISGVLVIFLLFLLWRPAKDMFTAVNTALTGAVDPGSINVQQPATEILKILAQDPNRYPDFFGTYNKVSSRDNQKYPLLWPLTAGDINNRLAFDPSYTTNAGNWYDGTFKKLIVTTSPPSGEMLWYTGKPGQPGGSDAQLRVYNPSASTATNNFLGGWAFGFGIWKDVTFTDAPFYQASCSNPAWT